MKRPGTTQERYTHALSLVNGSEKKKVPDACREAHLSTTTYYALRKEAKGKALTTDGYQAPKRRRRSEPELVQIVAKEEEEEVKIVIMKGKASVIQEIAKALGGVL